jgi:hypothetical protein
MINPVNPGNKDVKALSTMTLPELFDLRERLYMKRLMNSDTMKDSSQLSKIFRNDPFMAGEGLLKTYTEKDTQTYGTAQPEGTTGQLVKFGIGRTLNFTFVDYGNATTLTGKARHFNKNRDFINTIDIPMMLQNRRVLDGTHLLTFAFDASYVNMDTNTVDLTVIDGLSLINASHTTAQTGETFTNVITGNPVFGKAGLLVGETVLRNNTIDGYGALGSISPNMIITSTDPTQLYNVDQITKSSTEVGQDNSMVINALKKYEHIALSKLDTDATGSRVTAKSDMWFLADKNLLEAVYCQAIAISNGAPVEDKLKGYAGIYDITFPSFGAWIYRFITPIGLAGSNPT